MTLAELRRAANMSQLEAGLKIDVTQSCLSRWEVGLNAPLPKHRKRLCRLYNVTREELDRAVEESMRRRQ